MTTVFIGGAFKAWVDPDTRMIGTERRRLFEAVIEHFETIGCLVHNAHRDEGWGAAMVPAKTCTRRDWGWMRESDLFIVLPGIAASPGTHIELGWASAMGKPIIVLREPGDVIADLVLGLSDLAPVRYLTWRGPECLLELTEAARQLGVAVPSPYLSATAISNGGDSK